MSDETTTVALTERAVTINGQPLENCVMQYSVRVMPDQARVTLVLAQPSITVSLDKAHLIADIQHWPHDVKAAVRRALLHEPDEEADT